MPMAASARALAPARPLRVAHITGQSGPHFANGVSRAIYHLIGSERAFGHDVVAVSDQEETTSDVVASGRGSAVDRPSAGRHIDQSARPGYVPLEVRLIPRLRKGFDTLVRRLTEFRPSIVHLHSIHVYQNVSLGRYLRHVGVPYCVTVHGGLFGRRHGRLKKAAFWWLCERAYLNGALFVHALSTDEATDLKACGVTAPIVVAPNGIDLDALPRAVDSDALFTLVPALIGHRIFLFMGRLDPVQKGLDLLIEAFARADQADARLVLLGPDWKNGRAKLQEMVNRLGLGSKVVFLEPANPQRCADLVAGADVFVHASRWEGVSLSVLEAAAWGKASLLTRAADPIGALGAGGGALTVEATVDGLADGIRALSQVEREELTAMGRRAESVVSRTFRWSGAAKTLLDAYRPADSAVTRG
jgi:glycosyltransferase involved in cell wall biosynthesis